MLHAIAEREFPIPSQIDIFLLTREIQASDKTAIQCVIEVDQERAQLEKDAEDLAHFEDEGLFGQRYLNVALHLYIFLALYQRLFLCRISRKVDGYLRTVGRDQRRFGRSSGRRNFTRIGIQPSNDVKKM